MRLALPQNMLTAKVTSLCPRYTHPCIQIHGIWFYEQDDLNRLSTLLNRVKSGLPKTDILPAAAPVSIPSIDLCLL